MATAKTPTSSDLPIPPKKKRSSGPSGRTRTAAERRAAGLVPRSVWLDAEVDGMLETLIAAQGQGPKEALQAAIRLAYDAHIKAIKGD